MWLCFVNLKIGLILKKQMHCLLLMLQENHKILVNHLLHSVAPTTIRITTGYALIVIDWVTPYIFVIENMDFLLFWAKRKCLLMHLVLLMVMQDIWLTMVKKLYQVTKMLV